MQHPLQRKYSLEMLPYRRELRLGGRLVLLDKRAVHLELRLKCRTGGWRLLLSPLEKVARNAGCGQILYFSNRAKYSLNVTVSGLYVTAIMSTYALDMGNCPSSKAALQL